MRSTATRTSTKKSSSRAIEAALVSAAKKQYGEEEDIVVHIDRKDGSISGTHNGVPLDPEETVGRIGAQTAKQVMIQKIREAGARRPVRRIPRADRPDGHRRRAALRRRRGHRLAHQRRGHPAAQRADPRRNAPPQRTRAGHRLRSPQGRQPRQGHPQPHPAATGAAAVRAGNSRNRRRRDRNPRHGPRAGLPQQGGRQQLRPARRLRRGLRRRPRQPHQEHRRRTGRRADRHRPLERRPAGADPQRLAAGRGRRSHPLPDAGPGDRAGARGPAVAGHRPPRAERAAGQQALRLGHRDHDPRGARRIDRAGRGRASRRSKASTKA